MSQFQGVSTRLKREKWHLDHNNFLHKEKRKKKLHYSLTGNSDRLYLDGQGAKAATRTAAAVCSIFVHRNNSIVLLSMFWDF